MHPCWEHLQLCGATEHRHQSAENVQARQQYSLICHKGTQGISRSWYDLPSAMTVISTGGSRLVSTWMFSTRLWAKTKERGTLTDSLASEFSRVEQICVSCQNLFLNSNKKNIFFTFTHSKGEQRRNTKRLKWIKHGRIHGRKVSEFDQLYLNWQWSIKICRDHPWHV